MHGASSHRSRAIIQCERGTQLHARVRVVPLHALCQKPKPLSSEYHMQAPLWLPRKFGFARVLRLCQVEG